MRNFIRALLVFLLFSIVTGLIYPYVVTGLSRLFFPAKAEGSLLAVRGRVVGSALIGQRFASPRYFHGRPSALEKAYDAGNSGGSNLGPSSAKLAEGVAANVKQVRAENRLAADIPVPADLLLSSASGLDPHITYGAAVQQVPRVAGNRALPEDKVKGIIDKMAEGGSPGSPRRVNVLKLNLALDEEANR